MVVRLIRSDRAAIAYLYTRFAQVQAKGQFLACEDIGILCLLKSSLQLMQLERSKGGPAATDLSWLVQSRLLLVIAGCLVLCPLCIAAGCDTACFSDSDGQRLSASYSQSMTSGETLRWQFFSLALFCSVESASSFSMQKKDERELSGMKLDLAAESATRSAVEERVDIAVGSESEELASRVRTSWHRQERPPIWTRVFATALFR